MSASRTDTVAGNVTAQDTEGIDSVWVTLDSVTKGDDGGFNRVFSSRYRFIVNAGRTAGEHLSASFRARDISGFVAQKDTYVVVVP